MSIALLPDELLLEIFHVAFEQSCTKNATSPHIQDQRPLRLTLTLSQVDTRWKQICLGTQKFWSEIDITVDRPIGYKLPYLRYLLRRAWTLPISFTFWMKNSDTRWTSDSTNLNMTRCIQCVKRIDQVRIHWTNFTQFQSDFLPYMDEKFPSGLVIRKLTGPPEHDALFRAPDPFQCGIWTTSCSIGADTDRIFDVFSPPGLQRLILDGVFLPNPVPTNQIPLEGLREFRVRQYHMEPTNVKVIWDVMKRAPNLEILDAHAAFFRKDTPTEPVWDPEWALPPLKELYLSSFTAISLFFQPYTPKFPQLRVLELEGAYIEEKQVIEQFIAGCSGLERLKVPPYSDDSDL
ncbi:SubName: Full=Uncharacterized protein {ECO:0000313/EMBL:CCA73835.1} [Serendipita indica DSM 11827]|nr:SubName: Full=Uncharacterized protein {ECO:0000313/EMBL:CCA73835.1} [Serendipita indica DSM 11827]